MSLIQEALQRQQQETGTQGPPNRRATRTQPPRALQKQEQRHTPAPSSGGAPSGKSGGSPGKTIALLVLLAGLAAVFVLRGEHSFWEEWWSRLRDPGPERAANDSDPSPAPPATEPDEPPVVSRDEQPGLVPPDRAKRAETDPAMAEDAPARADEARPEETPDQRDWPRMKLNGIVGSGTQGSCLINGRIVNVGDTVQGVTIVAIHGDRVQLEYEGERRLVRQGETIR